MGGTALDQRVGQLEDKVNALIDVATVEAQIRKATARWKRYGYAVSKAYSEAYHEQEEVLKDVVENIKKMREEEAAVIKFAFTILTAGVGGPIAAAAAKKLVMKGVTDALEKKIGEAAIDAWKDGAADTAKKLVEGVSDKLGEALEGGSSKSAFEPPGVPPDQYGDEVQGGIEELTELLEGSVVDFLTKGAKINSAESKKLADRILNSEFIKHPPAVDDRDEFTRKLKRKASLALWLAWGWARDVHYWYMRSGDAVYTYAGKELVSFEPVRKVLVEQLGISQANRQVYAPMKGGNVNIIDMYAFIQWCGSAAARAMLFSNLPTNPKGLAYAQVQMNMQMINISLKKMGYVAGGD
jgi:hypothetical protein